jgi:tetratricopeptide (TPR) repeat protein
VIGSISLLQQHSDYKNKERSLLKICFPLRLTKTEIFANKVTFQQLLLSLIGSAICLCHMGCKRETPAPYDLSQATYVGSQRCGECHQAEMFQHQGSHHDLAMQLASESSVLGDFNNARLEHYGVTSRFYRQGDAFIVQTEGPDGRLQDFTIQYVFGVTPLQQYMVELPESPAAERVDGEIPRVQVLPLCWDTERREWFFLDPPDVREKLDYRDDLHWTGIAQRWNTMCADCHSTNFRRQFTPGPMSNPSDHGPERANQIDSGIGVYRSQFSEINVSCETCHGPGSIHVQLAGQRRPDWGRDKGYGLANLKGSAEAQVQACAPCHSRRSVIFPDYRAGFDYHDYHRVSMLRWPVYYPDGQVLDENYVYGSFIQSKMYHKGIRCTDCHDPHTARLKHQGNQVCTSCHQHPTTKYDTPDHHFHTAGSPGAQCVNCHMPETTYMKVDARRDHSFRIPRPDLSLLLGTPNACTSCHLNPGNISEEKRDELPLYQHWMQRARDGDAEVADEIRRADQWCEDACQQWYGDQRDTRPHWGQAIHAGQTHQANAVEQLQELLSSRGELAPFIARATALEILSEIDIHAATDEAAAALEDPHPLLRAVAAATLAGAPNTSRAAGLLEHSLQDPSRLVRIEAARSLLDLPAAARSPSARINWQNAIDELREGYLVNNDRSGAHLALGGVAEAMGQHEQAIQHYRTAIVVEPGAAGARTNLAALLGRNLESGSSIPNSVRDSLQNQISLLRKQELVLLERDVSLLPDPPAMLLFRYGLSLYLDGQVELAAAQIIRAAELNKDDATFAESAAEILERLQRWDQAVYWADQAVKRSGGSPQSKAIQKRILNQRGSQAIR